MSKTYTVKQVAQILGYSTNSIYTFLKEKRIKGVRVGKGRFRISEEELGRLLKLSKQKELVESTVLSLPVSPGLTSAPETVTPISPDVIGKRWSVPNLFDRMIALAAVVSGAALFLFNQSTSFEFVGVSGLSGFIRGMMIASGVGMFASSIVQKSGHWKTFFQLILAGVFGTHSWILGAGGDIDGAMLYGSLTLILGLTSFVKLDGVMAVSIYVSLVAVLSPIVVFFGGRDVQISALLSFIEITPLFASVIVSLGSLLFMLGFWSGYGRSLGWFWAASWAMSAAFLVCATLSATQLQWSKSFFLLAVSVTMGFLPTFRNYGVIYAHRQRVFIHTIFGMLGFLLVGLLIVAGLLQFVVWEENRRDFTEKVTFGQKHLIKTLETVEQTLATGSRNPEIAAALSSGDSQALESHSKVIYEGNGFIRRIVFVDKLGQGVTMYPHGTFDQLDFSFAEYFRIVRDSKKPHISDTFTTLSDGENRKTFIITVPVENEKKEFLGVMVGSIDMQKVGSTLQASAASGRNEAFIVIDALGRIVIAPEVDKIGQEISNDEVMSRALSGNNGVIHAQTTDGELGMIAFAPVSTYEWAMLLEAPAVRIYGINNKTIYLLFSLIGIAIVSSMVWMIHLQLRGISGNSLVANGP